MTTEMKLFHSAKKRAKEYGWEFNIMPDDIVIPSICPVFKVEMIGRFSPSLDRKDSTKGYTRDNIQVISKRANFLKCNATIEEVAMLYVFCQSMMKSSSNLNIT